MHVRFNTKMSQSLKEIIKYLQLGARLDLKAVTLTHVLGLTGSEDGIKLVIDVPELLLNLIILLQDPNNTIPKDASLCLVNVSANRSGANNLINLEMDTIDIPFVKKPKNVIEIILKCLLDKDCNIADPCCMILSNLSRTPEHVDKIIDFIEDSDIRFDTIVNAFTRNNYNTHGANLHYLGSVLSNLSQNIRMRKYILDKDKCVVQKLLAFTEYKDSIIRRGGVIGAIRNCCFNAEHHKWLLSEDVDILPKLLLPLADGTEFDEEDNDKLPLELQYLPEIKSREDDPDIRCMLLEALTQLCALRDNRSYVRDKNTYVILRELHKWEKDRKALLACENLVDLLIRTEEEIGEDNLKELTIPEDLQKKFDETLDEDQG